jgi:hypothetical protein
MMRGKHKRRKYSSCRAKWAGAESATTRRREPHCHVCACRYEAWMKPQAAHPCRASPLHFAHANVRLQVTTHVCLDTAAQTKQQNSNCMFEQRAANRTQAPIIHRRCGDSGPGNVEWETTARPQATNAASLREGGTSEVHRPQHGQQALIGYAFLPVAG